MFLMRRGRGVYFYDIYCWADIGILLGNSDICPAMFMDYEMRRLSEIERDIRKVSDLLNRLVLERKLTIAQIKGIEASAQILTEQAMKRMKDDKHWEPGL